jgi:hypothetical protein
MFPAIFTSIDKQTPNVAGAGVSVSPLLNLSAGVSAGVASSAHTDKRATPVAQRLTPPPPLPTQPPVAAAPKASSNGWFDSLVNTFAPAPSAADRKPPLPQSTLALAPASVVSQRTVQSVAAASTPGASGWSDIGKWD